MLKCLKPFRDGTIFPWEPAFTKEVLRIAIPIAVHGLFSAALHITDNIMIGWLGEVELAAVTQANRVSFLLQLFLFGISGGMSTFVSQFWGKKDMASIRQTMGLGLFCSLFVAVCFFIPSVLFPRALLGILLQNPVAIDVAAKYLPIVACGYLIFAVSHSFSTTQNATEQTRLPMVAGIVSLLVNTFLNYCLIFGRLGFPAMGATGGALATVIAMGIGCLILILGGYIYEFATAVRLSELMPPSVAFVKKFITVSLPVIANEGLWALGVVAYSIVYGRMGITAVAAMSVYNTVEQVAYVATRALVSAAAVLVGKRIGAGDNAGAQFIGRRFIWSMLPAGLLGSAILMLTSIPLPILFANVSPEALESARHLIRNCSIMLPMHFMAGLLIVGILRGGGDMTFSLFVDAGAIWVVGVPMVALGGLVLGLKIENVFWMAQVENVTKVLLCLYRFRSGKWIHNLTQ